MNTAGLFKVLSDIHPLTEGFKNAVVKELTPLSLPKNHMLLEAPKIAEHAYFLDQGFAMTYTFVDGKKLTDAFWKPGQIMLSFKSFFEQIPSLEYIQLMGKSELLCISYLSLQKILDLYPEGHNIYHMVMNRHYAHSLNRIHDMQRLNALQRLEKLLNVFPDIEQIVPQDAIASYLGIAAQSLSRLKRRKGDF